MPSTQFAWSCGCQKSKRWVIESVTLKRLNEVEWRQRKITGVLSPQALKLIPSFLLYKFMRYWCYNKNFYVEYFISLIISASLFQSAKGPFFISITTTWQREGFSWFWLWRSGSRRSMQQSPIGHYLRYRMSWMAISFFSIKRKKKIIGKNRNVQKASILSCQSKDLADTNPCVI